MPDPEWYNTPEKRALVNARRDEQERIRAEFARNENQKRLLAINQKLEAVGIELDDLIELIEARQEGRY